MADLRETSSPRIDKHPCVRFPKGTRVRSIKHRTSTTGHLNHGIVDAVVWETQAKRWRVHVIWDGRFVSLQC